jgi:hypothetical protein
MPVETAIFVSVIVAAFVIFALTLGWAEYRTRHHAGG